MNGTKSMIGHLLGAAGAVEAVATVQAIRTGAMLRTAPPRGTPQNLENKSARVGRLARVLGPKFDRCQLQRYHVRCVGSCRPKW